MKRIQITFLENNVSCMAESHEKVAPRTCAAIWDALVNPLETTIAQARWLGPATYFFVPPERGLDGATLPPENQTIFPIPGDLLFVYYAPHQLHGFGDQPLNEIVIAYDRDARMFVPLGWHPGNHFASIVEGFPAFVEMCAKTHREGVKKIRVRRA